MAVLVEATISSGKADTLVAMAMEAVLAAATFDVRRGEGASHEFEDDFGVYRLTMEPRPESL